MLGVLFFTLLVSFFSQTATALYNLAQDYSGDSFFQGWDFFTAADPTNGHVQYQSQVDAKSKGLIKVQNNNVFNRDVNTNLTSNKQIFIGVDSTTQAPNGRSSVRITTQKTFQHALVLADIAHQPGGICGVWPAFWMVGANWPQQGEIDIVEGVSTQATNQMTLHTNAGPVIDPQADFSGSLMTDNCDINASNQPKNVGCGIADTSNITFGSDFNAAGGGVYATEWTSKSIKIWFFPRNKIPADIRNGKPNPSDSWGTPNSNFQGAFKIDDHFKDLQIVLNTAFCGDWAGAIWSETPECAALAPTCDEYVTKNPKAFDQAFWLINSIKVFQDNGQATPSPSPSPSSRSSSSPTATSKPGITAPSTNTFTRTHTVYPTGTGKPRPKFNSTSDGDQGGPFPNVHPTGTARPRPKFNNTGDGNQGRPFPNSQGGGNTAGDLKPPGMMFGSPGFNSAKPKRHGGAVLPATVLLPEDSKDNTHK